MSDIGICTGCGQTVRVKDEVAVRHFWAAPLSPEPTQDMAIVCPGVGYEPVLAWYTGDLRLPREPISFDAYIRGSYPKEPNG